MISEFKDMSTINLASLFGKMQEYEMKLKRLANDEECDKKNIILALNTKEEKYSEFDEDIVLLVINCKTFMKHEKQKHFQHTSE